MCSGSDEECRAAYTKAVRNDLDGPLQSTPPRRQQRCPGARRGKVCRHAPVALMQRQAGLGVAEADWLAAINYTGYLSVALIASLISDLVLKDRPFRIGMVVVVPTIAMMGSSTNVTVWAVSRYLTGLCGAAGMLQEPG